jgi:hypothetical protein
MQGVECESADLWRWAKIEGFQKLTFGILAPRDLEELLNVGGFGRHLDGIRERVLERSQLEPVQS